MENGAKTGHGAKNGAFAPETGLCNNPNSLKTYFLDNDCSGTGAESPKNLFFYEYDCSSTWAEPPKNFFS